MPRPLGRGHHRGTMDLVSTEQFLAWAEAQSIGRNPQYRRSESLVYPAEDSTWYRYRYVPPVQPLHQFVDHAVTVAAAGSPLWLFPPWRGGQWYPASHAEFPSLTVLRSIVHGACVPTGYAGPSGASQMICQWRRCCSRPPWSTREVCGRFASFRTMPSAPCSRMRMTIRSDTFPTTQRATRSDA